MLAFLLPTESQLPVSPECTHRLCHSLTFPRGFDRLFSSLMQHSSGTLLRAAEGRASLGSPAFLHLRCSPWILAVAWLFTFLILTLTHWPHILPWLWTRPIHGDSSGILGQRLALVPVTAPATYISLGTIGWHPSVWHWLVSLAITMDPGSRPFTKQPPPPSASC